MRSFIFLALFLVSQVQAGQLLVLTDLHFNPFSACKTAPCEVIANLENQPIENWDTLLPKTNTKVGEDSHLPLLDSALHSASEQDVDTVLVLGDFLAHHFKAQYFNYATEGSEERYQRFVQKVIAFLTKRIQTHFPKQQIAITIGNNDTVQGDYLTDAKGTLFKLLLENKASPLKLAGANSSKHAFLDGGYYSADIPNTSIKIIALNSNLFSKLSPDTQQKATKAMAWLASTLEKAARQKKRVWLIMHIPEGIDVYKSLYSIDPKVFWQEAMSTQFMSYLIRYQDTIATLFSAHVHMDGWTLYRLKKQTLVNFVSPSVTPIFGNMPAYKLYQYTDSGKVTGSSTYYLDLSKQNATWQLSNRHVYNEAPSVPSSTGDYWDNYTVHGPNLKAMQKYFEPFYRCAITLHTALAWNGCVSKGEADD